MIRERLSGNEAIEIANSVFKGKNLNKVKSHTIHYGYICDKENIELGLKVYAATNVSKYPMTTRYLMSCVNLPAINKNVTIRNLKTQADVQYNLFGKMWYDNVSEWAVNNFHNRSDMPNATAEDREFALRIVHRFIKKYMRSSEVNRVKWLNKEE